MIAATRSAVAAITSTLLWPLRTLARKVSHANLQMVRWALRHQSGAAFLFAILWAPALVASALIGASLVAHDRPRSELFGVNWTAVRTALLCLLIVLQQFEGSKKGLRFYRRHFWSKRLN